MLVRFAEPSSAKLRPKFPVSPMEASPDEAVVLLASPVASPPQEVKGSPAALIEIVSRPGWPTAKRTVGLPVRIRFPPSASLCLVGNLSLWSRRRARSQRRRWLHDGVAGPFNRTYRQGLWSEPAARSQPSADILLRAKGQQPPKSRAGRDPGGATSRTAAVSGCTGRSRRQAPRGRHPGRADRRSLPAVRGSRSFGLGVGAD